MPRWDHEHPVLHEDDVSLRPATPDDLDRLAAWFVDPGNYRWWGGVPKQREEVAEKYIGRRCPRVESFLIQVSDEPIGYIQYHLEGPGQAGLDMMLTPAWRDRGIGPRAARLLISHLVLDRGWTDITVDPAEGTRVRSAPGKRQASDSSVLGRIIQTVPRSSCGWLALAHKKTGRAGDASRSPSEVQMATLPRIPARPFGPGSPCHSALPGHLH